MKNAVLSLVCAVALSASAASIWHSIARAVLPAAAAAPVPSRSLPPAPVEPAAAGNAGEPLAVAFRSLTAQALSSAQADVLPHPGDDPRLDAWRIWLHSPEKGTRGPYTFWDIMQAKASFGAGFAMPGNPGDERDSFGNLVRGVWHTTDEATP